VFEFPAGEAHKTRATWMDLSDRLLARGIGRDAAVIALGGGVVGDVAGFVAATYMRGVPCIQVPTTLLAMIDASIGGKTGVDVTAGKNLIGAFHPPGLVVVDPLLLDTLPDAELRNGLAEAVKHGAIADARHFRWLVEQAPVLTRRDPAALSALIRHSVEIKAAVVGRDPDERGERAILNFGHTAGHALERLTGYAMPHGHAVSIGMVIAARLGESMGVTEAGTTDALREALDGFALPTRPPDDVAPADLAAAAVSDKKARAGTIRFSLLRRIGVAAQTPDAGWTFPVEASALAAALAGARSTARA
jgi:3-dehydroquinate synthase